MCDCIFRVGTRNNARTISGSYLVLVRQRLGTLCIHTSSSASISTYWTDHSSWEPSARAHDVLRQFLTSGTATVASHHTHYWIATDSMSVHSEPTMRGSGNLSIFTAIELVFFIFDLPWPPETKPRCTPLWINNGETLQILAHFTVPMLKETWSSTVVHSHATWSWERLA